MRTDFKKWLEKEFREAGANRRDATLEPEDTLQDQIDLYADINDVLGKFIHAAEDRTPLEDNKDVEMLFLTVRERAAQGEALLVMISDALKSGEPLPHPAKTLQDFARSVQDDIARDRVFGDELWQEFKLYNPEP